MTSTYRLAILNSHPIQYFAPLYRRLAQEPNIDLTVYYCSREGVETYPDSGFGVDVRWDTPLLDGYQYKFLPNAFGSDHVGSFFSLFNPAIVGELKRKQYDVLWVHGHNYATFVFAMMGAKLFGIRVLMRCETHLHLRRTSFKRIVRTYVMQYFYKMICDACLAIGTLNYDFYRSHGVGEAKLFFVPYTVDNTFFLQAAQRAKLRQDELRAQFGLPVHKPLILFASKMIRRKRPMDVLLAYQNLRERHMDAALVFVGAGNQEQLLRQYVRDHKLEGVYFLGFRNQSELPSLYAIADVFVLPSENEPWGLIINEVMCAGLPVVATDEIGAVVDLVQHGHNGFVFPVGDVPQLTAHLSTLISNPTLREQMGFASQARIEQWSFEVCVDGVQAAMSKVVHNNM